MSAIGSISPQSSPVPPSSQKVSTSPATGKDGDGDHGVEPAAQSTPATSAAIPPGQPGAIINTTA